MVPWQHGLPRPPWILETAPQEVKEKRALILASRHNNPHSAKCARTPPSETNLLVTGCGCLISASATSQFAVAATAQDLNFSTGRAGEIIQLAQRKVRCSVHYV